MYTFVLILSSEVCSALSVRCVATEVTTIIIEEMCTISLESMLYFVSSLSHQTRQEDKNVLCNTCVVSKQSPARQKLMKGR